MVVQPSILPAPLRQLLSQIHQLEPEAIVAGGYLRDVLTGHAPKDIDIFVPYGGAKALSKLFQKMSSEVPAGVLAYSESEVWSVWSLGISHEGIPLQLIELTEELRPCVRFEYHDFGICQVMDDGSTLRMTELARKDLDDRTFTVSRHEGIERTKRRWARLGARYSGYSLVVPEGVPW